MAKRVKEAKVASLGADELRGAEPDQSTQLAPRAGVLTSQRMRLDLGPEIASLGECEVRDFGGTRGPATHQLVGIKASELGEVARGVRVTVDQARKSWTDLKACARILGIPFVVIVDGKGKAVIRRHPENMPKRAPRWIQEFMERAPEDG